MELGQAEDILRRSLALMPDRPAAHLALARLLQRLGRLDEAMSATRTAAAACGDSPDIIVQRISILREMGEWRKALPMARDAAAGTPWHMGLWEQWLRLEWLEDDPGAIESCLAAAPAQTLRERAAGLFRGVIAGSHWRLEEAISWQREVLRLNPQHNAAFRELARLSLLTLDIEATRDCLRQSARRSATADRLQGRSPSAAPSRR